jgi:hypothetical protein
MVNGSIESAEVRRKAIALWQSNIMLKYSCFQPR